MSDIRFKPVRGTDEQIQNLAYTEGAVYFATDTKKIYMDADDTRRPMGGNSGIYFGSMPEDENADTDKVDFNFLHDQIEGDQKPNENDLILNIPDGCFYRVVGFGYDDYDNEVVRTKKLTIAGGGGGGSTGPGISRFMITDVDKNTTRYFTKDTKSATLNFNVKNTVVEENYIVSTTYTLGNIETIVDNEVKEFGTLSFDLMPYLHKFSTASQVTVNIRFTDVFGTKGSIDYYINVVDLMISSFDNDNNKKILFAEAAVNEETQEKEVTYYYQYRPSGGSRLDNRRVVFTISDINGNPLQTYSYAAQSGSEDSKYIKFPGHGIYQLSLQFLGETKSTNPLTIYSNIITHQVVCYDKEEGGELLTAFLDNKVVEQYTLLKIPYMVAGDADSGASEINVELVKDGVSSARTVTLNTVTTWDIQFNETGSYHLLIKCGDLEYDFDVITVVPYSGDMPIIDASMESLKLLMTATNRSNSEVLSERTLWKSAKGTAQGTLSNFYWGKTNGWLLDEEEVGMLRLTAGARLDIDNFRPFETNATQYGLTIELDFKVSGVTDYSRPVIACMSMNGDLIQTGFQITGQESTINSEQVTATGGVIVEGDSAQDQIYNTAIQGMTAKFTEDERIHLTWVIERENNDPISRPLVITYLNGVISGMTQYANDDNFKDLNVSPATISINSDNADIDIYNIRVYSAALDKKAVLNNHMATLGTPEARTEIYNKNLVMDEITQEILLDMIEAEGFELDTPYVKLTGGTSLNKWDVTNVTDDNGNLIYKLPEAKKDYRLMSFEFINQKDPTQNFKEGISLEHEDGTKVTDPKDVTKSGFKVKEGCQAYGQGTSSMEYPVKNLRIKFKKNRPVVYDGACPVDLVCFKADYMESSGSHNTGTANLIYDLYSALDMKTPAQTHYTKENGWNYDVVTAIRGFPIPVFWSPSGEPGTYEFIGKYNFNLDKATPEPFGFMHDDTSFGKEEGYHSVTIKKEKVFDGYPFDLFKKNGEQYVKVEKYDPTIPASEYYAMNNKIHCFEFLNNADSLDNFLSDEGETFEETFYKIVDSDGDQVPKWYTCFESRYPEFEDYHSTEIDEWFRLCNWVNSTKDDINKFKNEFNQYLNFDFTCFYYVITHVLLMIDSRAKNCFLATWDGKIWYPIMYDMDTMLGLNNYGYNKFNYDAEDTERGLYNGQDSVLWNNFREAFKEEIAEFYNDMRQNGLNYDSLIYRYNKVQADAINEAMCNADAYYKYVRPFTEGYVNSVTGENVWVSPGSTNYLYAGQGRRSMHRQWWLSNRLNYFDGKHLAEAYKQDRFIMRVYTPGTTSAEYLEIGVLTEEMFLINPSGYYYKSGETFIQATETDWTAERVFYTKNQNTGEQIETSAVHVPPHGNFNLTPLQNQYLSVAYGGDNGYTTKPVLVPANTEYVVSPEGSTKYNDTETYIYGGSKLKDLGDLSSKYLGKFQFPVKICKLERLVIGNPNQYYYNPNFSSLSIGASAPFLKHINIMNCNGLNGLDLNSCQRIQEVLATGSALKNILLPTDGILTELRLPQTLNILKVINHVNLTDEKFTVGTCNYNAETDTYTYTNDFSKISRLHIVNTPINTQKIVEDSQVLAFYKLPDIDWTITENTLDSGKLTTVDLVDKLMNCEPAVDGERHSHSLTGTIKLAVSGASVNAIDIYEKYWPTYPNLFFEYDTNVMTVNPTYKINFLDGSGETYWLREIEKGKDLTEEFLSNGPKGAWKLPSRTSSASHVYTFTGNWRVDGTETIMTTDEIKALGNIQQNWTFEPVFIEEIKKYDIFMYDEDETLLDGYPIQVAYGSTIPECSIVPYKSDATLPLDQRYTFKGFVLKNSNAIINLSETTVTQTYHLYAKFAQESVYDAHTDYKYFLFDYGVEYPDSMTVYNDEDKDPQYATTGAAIRLNPEFVLHGKITLPSKAPNGTPIVAVANRGFSKDGSVTNNPHQITHIFWERDTQVREYRANAFHDPSGTVLEYIEIPDSLRRIGASAFSNVSFTHSIHTGANVYWIGDRAFNGIFAPRAQIESFTVGPNVTRVDEYSFSYFEATANIGRVYFGTPTSPSQLAYTGSAITPTDIAPIFVMNSSYDGGSIGGLEIYCTPDRKSYFENLVVQGVIRPSDNNEFDITIKDS